MVAALLLVLAPLGYFFGGTVIRFATNQGELVIEVHDADVEVVIRQDSVELTERTKRRTFVLTAGRGEVEVYEKNGGIKLATKQFTLSRGGKTTVSVTAEVRNARTRPIKFKAQPAADADRRVAEWVLNLKGQVHGLADGKHFVTHPGDRLPEEPFQIVLIELGREPEGLTDDDLRRFRELRGLRTLKLLDLRALTDRGAGFLQDLAELESLTLQNCGLTDKGLESLKGLTALRELAVGGTEVSDAGLAVLCRFQWLADLDLGRTQVTDAGLKHLRDLRGLTRLLLYDNPITNEGLAHLSRLTQLKRLNLVNTRVSDAGLEHLKKLTKLEHLMVKGTDITAEGVRKLQAALPQCTINTESP